MKSRLLCSTPYVDLFAVSLRVAGHSRTYYVSRFGERVGAVVLKGASVLLVRQYRFLVGGMTWEIPGGRIERGETPAAAASRECLEETGWAGREFRPLISYWPGTDIIDNRTHVLWGHALERRGRPQPGETRMCRWVDRRQWTRWIDEGRIVCGMTLAALLALRCRGLR